jgi:hypothetical protein
MRTILLFIIILCIAGCLPTEERSSYRLPSYQPATTTPYVIPPSQSPVQTQRDYYEMQNERMEYQDRMRNRTYGY